MHCSDLLPTLASALRTSAYFGSVELASPKPLLPQSWEAQTKPAAQLWLEGVTWPAPTGTTRYGLAQVAVRITATPAHDGETTLLALLADTIALLEAEPNACRLVSERSEPGGPLLAYTLVLATKVDR